MAKEGGKLLASKEPGWPQWRGPRRDGISDEKNLLQSWPAGGPPLLWKTEGLGRGWSSPVVTGGSIYLTGDVGEELRESRREEHHDILRAARLCAEAHTVG